mgnify:CR=1 FL=1
MAGQSEREGIGKRKLQDVMQGDNEMRKKALGRNGKGKKKCVRRKYRTAGLTVFIAAAACFGSGCKKEVLPDGPNLTVQPQPTGAEEPAGPGGTVPPQPTGTEEPAGPGELGQEQPTGTEEPAGPGGTVQPQPTGPEEPAGPGEPGQPQPTGAAEPDATEQPGQIDFEIKGDILLRYNGTETNVTVPAGVKRIGSSAFQGNSALVSVFLPEEVELIANQAFAGCRNLKEINLQHVQEIASEAFQYCQQLTKVNLEETQILGKDAFFGSGIREAKGLEKLQQLGNNVFYNTPLFGNYDVLCGSDLLMIGNVLFAGYRCSGAVEIPEGVEIIASYAFEGAKELISVSCSDSVKEIQNYAFASCAALEEFWMTDSVVSAGKNILTGCCKLRDLRLSNQLQNMPLLDFMDANSLKSITIPERCAVPSNLLEYDFDYGPYDRGAKKITVAPNKKVYGFLKKPYREYDEIYSSETFDVEWFAASVKYGWSLFQLALESEELTLAPGEQHRLAFNSGAKAEWTSENDAVVRVDRDGGLTAVKEGRTEIVATIYGKEYRCRVVVQGTEEEAEDTF